MNNSTTDALLKILEAIDYSQNKEVFIKDFIELTSIQSVESLILLLSPDQQALVKNELSANKENPDKIGEILKSRFSQEQMQKSLEETTQRVVTEWMQAINPTLNDEQRQKLVALSQ